MFIKCLKCTTTLIKVNDITTFCENCQDIYIEGHPIYNLDEELKNYYENKDY
jgi:hypothetical protein